jgi:hypothetical protein
MKSTLGCCALAALTIITMIPRIQAQAISPGHAVDSVEVVRVTAVVDAVDLAKRKVTLTLADGKKKTYKVDKSVQNFDKVQPGDHLNIATTEELVVKVNKSGEPASAGEMGEVGVAPSGSKPGIVMVQTNAVSGTILAVDAQKHKVSFQDPEGKKRTVKVRKSVDLSGLTPGESFDAVATESVVVDITKS